MSTIDHDEVTSNVNSIDSILHFLNLKSDMLPSEESLSKKDITRSLYQLGKVYYDKADLNQAQIHFEKSLQGAELPADTYAVLKVLGFLIRIASEKVENDKAENYIAQAQMLVESLTRQLGSLNADYFYNVGIIHNYKGEFAQALNNFQIAYEKSKKENEPDTHAKSLLALANTNLNLKNHEVALDYLTQLTDLLKIIDKQYLTGALHLAKAKVYLELDKIAMAFECFSNANKILNRKKCWNLQGYILMGKGIAYKKLGDYNKALMFFQLAKESIDSSTFARLDNLLDIEIQDVNDSSVDLYLDRTNRIVQEKTLGKIDFKHRFVLLEILFLLAKNSGTFYDKEDLAKQIWKDEYNPLIHDKLIYTSVSRLRKLIEPKINENEKRKYIIRGKDGYTFNPNVKIRFNKETKVTMVQSIGNVELSSPV